LGWLIRSVNTPAHYFWAAGALSSFLDNAPTYLTFFNSALGKFYPGVSEAQAVASLIVEKVPYLAAISAGAVFMGANTYIGNAPNFMVKSIAEEAGVKMPSFFGYMFKYSIPVLVVLFIIITVIFF
ncbi:MAG: sodium:proton antiporter, partial [Smithellaceae bacterium]